MKTETMKKITRFLRLDLVIAVSLAFLAGFLIKGMTSQNSISMIQADAGQQSTQMWTCSMHPQIQQPKPGKCPICFMDLIPVTGDDHPGHTGPRQISFSEDALKLMDIQTVPVERKFVEASIRMVGKIDYDETRLEDVAAWVPGRIDRLYVDFEGTRVIKGDHMFYLYSPELISAQAEFLQALKASKTTDNSTSDLIRRSTQATLEAAREKLRLLGVTDEQIEDLKKAGQPTDHITIYAPRNGIVIKRHVSEGSYVKTGSPIYTIADLSKLWVKLDAYESDMIWLRYGQQVEFTTEAYPGQVFKGQITFIAPTVDSKTRTIKLRVNVDNSNGRLKPEMFVRAVVRSSVAGGGLVADPNIIGKWICPMHPSIIKDSPGECDICHMELVKTDTLDYTAAVTPEQAPLVIPVSAALITGKRSIVYIKSADTEKPTFEGRQVVLGPRAGDYYLVEEGLSEGDIIVTNGSFKIDSALQILAKPSMMSPQDASHAEHNAMPGEQTLCPVMGGPVNKDIFIEYKGKKVYFCCEGCDDIFLQSPEKYMDKLPQFKQQLDIDPTEQTICPVMGNPISKEVFVEYQGKKVYFCCPGCIDEFQKNPEKYLEKLPQFNQNGKDKK